MWSPLALATALALAGSPEAPKSEGTAVKTFYDLKVNKLDGSAADLGQYKGKVLVVVNTASECGFTPQYAGLEDLYKKMKDKGVVVLGFPSNDFGGQEPDSPDQIQKFCKTKFGVDFPMFEKVKTKGPEKHAVYAFLSAGHGEPQWNFHKYIVSKDGHVMVAFPSKVTPDSPALLAAIDKALAN
jgi:glutathione peroxidase